MIIKHSGYSNTTLSKFDLLGHKETSFTKALAYVIASDNNVLVAFLKLLGVKLVKNNISNIEITIEKSSSDKDRTDIEIELKDKFHIIIEAKIGSNIIKNQHSQYITRFDTSSNKQCIMCYLSTMRDTNLQIEGNICYKYISWYDVIDVFARYNSAKEFTNYLTKNFKMKDQKEILIQDVGIEKEITRFKDYNVYRRDVTIGTPLYFAPYFTRKSGKDKCGISYLSKILGVITTSADKIDSFKDNLMEFCDKNEEIVKNWIKGVKLDINNSENLNDNNLYTYYFLHDPTKIDPPLLKDDENSINWIARMIPKNRCVSFNEFTRRIIQTETK